MARVPPGILLRPAAASFLAGFVWTSLELVVQARRVDGHSVVDEGLPAWSTRQSGEKNATHNDDDDEDGDDDDDDDNHDDGDDGDGDWH